MMTLYLDNGVVALFQVRAVPLSGDPNGVASIFGRMMQRGVSIAVGPVRLMMDRAIRMKDPRICARHLGRYKDLVPDPSPSSPSPSRCDGRGGFK